MNYMDKNALLKRLQEHLDEVAQNDNRDYFAVFLQGSQNYVNDLFSPTSDVDSRVALFPSVKDVCLGFDTDNSEYVLANDEHAEKVDVRNLLKRFLTPGVNNLECLFTEYVLVNPEYQDLFDELMDMRNDVARLNEKKFLMSTMGLSQRDLKDLQRANGNQAADVEKYGFSRKRLANLMRFNATVKAYLAGETFDKCMKALPQETLFNVRYSELYTLDEALDLAKRLDQETFALANAAPRTLDNQETKDKLEDLFVRMLQRSMAKGK